VEEPLPLFQEHNAEKTEVMLPKPGEGENIIADYASSGVSLRRHPLALLTSRLAKKHVHTAQALWSVRNRCRCPYCRVGDWPSTPRYGDRRHYPGRGKGTFIEIPQLAHAYRTLSVSKNGVQRIRLLDVS
jgi:hypothetical protein